MEISAVAGVVLVALIGLWPTMYAARRLGLILPVSVGLATQAVITIGMFIALGLWAPDAIKYHEMGQEIATHLRGGPTPILAVGDGKQGFPNLLGGLYWAFGANAAIGLAVNWIAHGALVVTLSSVAHRISLPARNTAWVVALFPPILLWSGLLLRESLAWLLIAMVALGLTIFTRASDRKQYLHGAAYAVGGLLALTTIRGSAAIIIFVAAVFALAANIRRATWRPHLVLTTVMFAVLLPQLAPLVGKYLPEQSDLIIVEQPNNAESNTTVEPDRDVPPATNDALTQTREALSRDASTSFTGDNSQGPPSMLSTGVRIIAGPFPSEWSRVGVPQVADSTLWLCVLCATGVGAWRQRRNWQQLIILALPALLLAGALVVTSGNYGTMQRLRLQSTILLIPIAVACATPRGALRANRELTHQRAAKDSDEEADPAALQTLRSP